MSVSKIKLLHKLLPERVNSETLKSISIFGLKPRLPSEYKMSLPSYLQEVPLVWLAERMNTIDGVIFSIDTNKLDKRRLHKLNWGEVDWWVYEGIVPPELLTPVAMK